MCVCVCVCTVFMHVASPEACNVYVCVCVGESERWSPVR